MEDERMSVVDPIGDMLTRMRNAVMAGHNTVAMPSSKIKVAIAKIMKEEGFISNFEIADGKVVGSKVLRLRLKYIGERRERHPVISGMERISRPGRRVYSGKVDIPWVLSGIGIAIISTPKGVMTGLRARQLGVGGEVLCKVW
jgi:small subunit ribosomal protein S8